MSGRENLSPQGFCVTVRARPGFSLQRDWLQGGEEAFTHHHQESCDWLQDGEEAFTHHHQESCDWLQGGGEAFMHHHQESCDWLRGRRGSLYTSSSGEL